MPLTQSSYLVRIGSTGNVLEFIRPDLTATSVVSGSTVSIIWHEKGNHFKIKDVIDGNNLFVALSTGQVSVANVPDTSDPYKFSVLGNSAMSGTNLFYYASDTDDENIIVKSIYSAGSKSRYAAIKFYLPDDPIHTTNRRAYIGYGYSDRTSANPFLQTMYTGLGINATFGDINIGTESPYNVNFITNNDTVPKLIVLSSRNVSVSANLNLSGNINFPTRVRNSTTSGIIYQGTDTLIHRFYPLSGGALANLFIGNAGNFTLSGSLTSAAWEGGDNLGIGDRSLQSIRNGYANLGVGAYTLSGNLSGSGNVAVGSNSMVNNWNSSNNTAIGGSSMRYLRSSNGYNVAIGAGAGAGTNGHNGTAYQNVFIGGFCGNVIGAGFGNMGMGYQSCCALTSGSRNIAIGYRTLSSETTGSYNIMIGNEANPSATSGISRELNIGNTMFGTNISNTTPPYLGIYTRAPNSTFHVSGSTSFGYTYKSASYTLGATDHLVEFESGSSITATLPTAVGISGRQYIIKSTGAGTVTVKPSSSQLIDDQTFVDLSTKYDKLIVMSNGSYWLKIS